MTRLKYGFTLSFVSLVLLGSPPLLAASKPIFSIVPTADSLTALVIPHNFTETITYHVTNNTTLTRTLSMVQIAGISQSVTGSGVCGNPFTLAPQESCLLSLTVHGSKVPNSGIRGGPVICKTIGSNDPSPDPFLCAQPNPRDSLAISVATTSGQHAYIANQLASNVSFCQVNPITGLLSQCAITATALADVEAVGVNPTGTLFYSANLGSSTVSVCTLNASTGALNNCIDSGAAVFNQPDGVAFSPDGTIFYASNVGGTVSSCLINPATGELNNCINNASVTFAAPSDMALNAAGTLAYVANRLSSRISVCNVSGQTLSSCNDLSGSLFNAPEGITLHPSGAYAYIANAGDGKIIVCHVRQDLTGLLEDCSATDGPFHGTGNVAFNATGTVAYVPNQLASQVFACQVSSVDGTLSQCIPSLGIGFVGPSGITLH